MRLYMFVTFCQFMKVGAQTETELKEKKLRVEDALNATKVLFNMLCLSKMAVLAKNRRSNGFDHGTIITFHG